MSDFDIMKAIARRDGQIFSCGLANMAELKKVKHGYKVTLNISYEVAKKLFREELVGALYLIDRDEFLAEKQAQAKRSGK